MRRRGSAGGFEAGAGRAGGRSHDDTGRTRESVPFAGSGKVGYPGCRLTATVVSAPEGRSEAHALGTVIRIPRLEQLTLTNEKTRDSNFAGILRGAASISWKGGLGCTERRAGGCHTDAACRRLVRGNAARGAAMAGSGAACAAVYLAPRRGDGAADFGDLLIRQSRLCTARRTKRFLLPTSATCSRAARLGPKV